MPVTPGMLRHYDRTHKDSAWRTCAACEFHVPRYPGRYPKACPCCGEPIAQDPPPTDPPSLAERAAFAACMDAVAETVGARFVAADMTHAAFAVDTPFGTRRLRRPIDEVSVVALRRHVVEVAGEYEGTLSARPAGIETAALDDIEDVAEAALTEAAPAFRSAVAVIVKDRTTAAKVLIGKSKADDDRGGTWCFPGGRIDDGEDAGTAAEREAWEETGARVKSLGRVLVIPAIPHVAFVLCDYGDGVLKPNKEFSALRWLRVRDAWKAEGLYRNVESICQRMSAEVRVVEAFRAVADEASAGPGARPLAQGQGAPKTDAQGRPVSDAPEKEPSQPQPRPEPPAKRGMPEPASTDAEAPQGEEPNGAAGGAAQEPPGPKTVRLRFTDRDAAEDARSWLQSMGVAANVDGLQLDAQVKDPTELEIVARTASAYGLDLAGAA